MRRNRCNGNCFWSLVAISSMIEIPEGYGWRNSTEVEKKHDDNSLSYSCNCLYLSFSCLCKIIKYYQPVCFVVLETATLKTKVLVGSITSRCDLATSLTAGCIRVLSVMFNLYFTRCSNTSHQLDHVRMRFQFLHQFKFWQQVPSVWFWSIRYKKKKENSIDK